MADERIDIEITDKVSPNIKRKVLEIAQAAIKADSAISRLKRELEAINGTALSKLSAASSKTTNALARQTNATARLTAANAKMKVADTRSALAKQRLATETQRTAAAQSRATAAQNAAAASASRASIAAIRLTQAQDRLNNATKRTNLSMRNFVSNALAFVTFGAAGAGIIRFADSFTILQNKLKNVTDTEKQLVDVTNQVFDIAKRTRAPVKDTAQAFQRFDLAMRQLGASQQESLRLTETVNKALTLSGANTGEQTAALLQLSQAFNKGKLDGDEFRTVMELMPTVADAIAKEMGVLRGELLELAPQGRITAQVMRDAFANAKDDIDKGFAKTIPTVGQSVTVLFDEIRKFTGELDKSLGVTNSMAKAILFLSDNIKILTVSVTALGVALATYLAPAILAKMTAGILALKGALIGLAATNPILLALTVTAGAAVIAIDQIRSGYKDLADEVEATNKNIRDFEKLMQKQADNKFLTELRGGKTQEEFQKGFTAFTRIPSPIDPANKKETKEFDFTDKTIRRVKKEQAIIQKQLDDRRRFIKEEEKIEKERIRKLNEQAVFAQKVFAELHNFKTEREGLVEIDEQLKLLDNGYKLNLLSLEQYRMKLVDLGVEAANLRLKIGQGSGTDFLTSAIGKMVEDFDNALASLTVSFGNFFKTLSDGFADSIGKAIVGTQSLKEGLREVAKTAVSELISSLIKLGIQYTLNATLAKSLAASTAAANVGVAGTTAAAWAPAASLASLATLGTNAAPASAAITSTMALTQGLTLASRAIAGFKDGGYTGSAGINDVAGVVHGREFVVNAEATARNRDTLEAMNKGRSVSGSNAPQLNVKVENYGNSQISVKRVSATDVRIIAREVADSVVNQKAPGVIASDLSNPNGRVSRSLSANTNMQRKR